MSQSKRASRDLDDDEKEMSEQQEQVRKITAQLRKRELKSDDNRASPFMIGWKPSCPHCGKPLELVFQDNGSYELTMTG